MAHEEYLRRNLIHASAVGCKAGLDTAIKRLEATKRPPKWLLEQLRGCLDRAEKVHPEVAKWRNIAPDGPNEQIASKQQLEQTKHAYPVNAHKR